MKLLPLVFTLILLFTSCSSQKPDRLKIVVNSWIGYSPIVYAYNKGWLQESNIKIVEVSSLAENLYLFGAKGADAFTGTQYEYNQAKKETPSLTPLLMLDKSYGGDIVLSNRTIEELQSTTSDIDAYLEINSINSLVLEDFLSDTEINDKRINFINQDPVVTSNLKNTKERKAILIATYSPADVQLVKNGFKIIASTKDENSIFVIDALYASQDIVQAYKEQFKLLKEKIAMAIEVSAQNPQEYYKYTKHFLQDISFTEFKESLLNIKWVHKKLSQEEKKSLINESFPIDGLL